MEKEQLELFNQLRSAQIELTKSYHDYWIIYSNQWTWQFWLNFLILLVPLIVLYFRIDRRNILLLGFYGLNVHTWFAYTDSIGTKHGLWGYPYQLTTAVLSSFSLDASLVPVAFMLVYQWTLNHKKNFYVYSAALSAIFAFILKPLLVSFHLFKMYMGINPTFGRS